jgi:hypothetical protein
MATSERGARDLAEKACETDDTTLFDEAASLIAQEDLDLFHKLITRVAIRNNALAILGRLLDRGVSFKTLWPTDVVRECDVSIPTLEYLLVHGWDINYRLEDQGYCNARPFMWHVVDRIDLVKWCLDHGASVHPRGQEPLSKDVLTLSQRRCDQILEVVAERGSIATFELLRSKGAPLGWRPLHLAVEYATYGHEEQTENATDDDERICTDQSGKVLEDHDDKESRAEHDEKKRDAMYNKKIIWPGHDRLMEMVRHLIDVVGFDVNAPDQPAGCRYGSSPGRNGTPICYIPGSGMLERDTRELTWMLLDRGADPAPALKWAVVCDYPKFAEDVEAWKTARGKDWKCCIL